MRRSFLILSLIIIISGCTKEVPEGEKRLTKSIEETSVRKVIENYVAAYNSNDIEAAILFFDRDYRGIVADSNEIVGLDALKNDLLQYSKQYPDGKWEIKIDELNVFGDFAYALCSGSFLMPDPIEKKMNPIYSERGIRIFKKQKDDGWKIFRYVAAPTFSYDQK